MSIANTLQRVLMPNAKFGSSESMYVKGQSYVYRNQEVVVFSGGRISLDTYYNGFSTVVWKKECGISNLTFKATGQGIAHFRMMLITEELVKFELTSDTKELNHKSQAILEFDISEIEQFGLIYIEMISVGDSFIFSGGEWHTNQEPRRKVKLGISITHFDRKKYVIPSIKRIKKEILQDENYKDKIYFTVVDNSKNITEEEADGVRVIPNENTGGAGGFMRGLLHYMEDKDFTHVLFMDDDASCETEAIKKTYSILSYSLKDNTAISGALFMETHPDNFIEKGAYFDSLCRPLFHGWCLNKTESVVHSETFIQQPNYGGWWFFAFPIKHVKHMAFPFFVRGDDILFSMMNDFNIVTTNGIACYAEDFSTKVSPMTWYLDTRNHLLNMLFFKRPVLEIIKTYSHYYLMCLLSHQYGSAQAVRLALRHVLGDPKFWEDNVDLKKVRVEINEISLSERMNNIELPRDILNFHNDSESRTRRWLRVITLNGMLLPLRNKMVYQNKIHRASLRQIFRYKKIFYYNRYNNKGYIAEVSRKKFFNGLIDLFLDCKKIYIQHDKQQEKYENLMPSLTSKDFWKDKLNLDD